MSRLHNLKSGACFIVLNSQKIELVFDDQHRKLHVQNYILYNFYLGLAPAVSYDDITEIRLEYHYWLWLKSYRLELHGDLASKYKISYFKFMKGGLNKNVYLEVINIIRSKVRHIATRIND